MATIQDDLAKSSLGWLRSEVDTPGGQLFPRASSSLMQVSCNHMNRFLQLLGQRLRHPVHPIGSQDAWIRL